MIDWTKVITTEDKLEKAKEAKKILITQAYKEYISSSINTSFGCPMQFNMLDSLMIKSAIELAQTDGMTSIYITDAEDVTHYEVSLADAQTIFLEMTTAFAAAHTKKKQHLRSLIMSCKTQSELDNIKWD